MIRWLRIVMPPPWTVLLAVFWYVGLDVFLLSAEWRLGLPYNSIVESKIFIGSMGFLVVGYAVYRVWAFHPALRPSYYFWLLATPWTSQKRLPFGPVHLVIQDVFVLAAVVGLCWPRCGIKSLVVLQVFLACYCLLLCNVLVYTGQRPWANVGAVGLGFMGLFALSPLFYVAAAFTYAATLLGLRASLAHFPWKDLPQFQKSQQNASLGWPHDRLGPGFPNDFSFLLGSPTLNGLLVGWWVFVALYHINPQDFEDAGALFMCSSFLVIPIFARIGFYCDGYLPPLSLRGRVALGRLIIPSYDQVFVAPLLALLVLVALCLLSVWRAIPAFFSIPLEVTLTWWILFGMGPSLTTWRLTGNHRIVKGLMFEPAQRK